MLTGCAWLPQADEDVDAKPATRAQLEERFMQLETTVMSQCGGQQEQFAQQQQRLDRVTADLGEIGSLLRGLQSGLAQANSEPEQVTRECTNDASVSNKSLLGRSEWIGLPSVGTYLKARIDSGATTSSLSATEITRFERDGEDWVRFKLGLNDDDSVVDGVRGEWIEAPVDRRVRIIQASGEDSRPVISLMMTLGPLRETVQFTLNDRTHLDHPVLLGRRFLLDIAIIDVAEQYLHERPEFPGGRPAADAGADEATDADAQPEG
ncbi:ATP-dependent zinc protease [Halomonas saccharevitans]|uniref:ATP-dependent zinc protease n=1 Tax=Halomonas saccharevitans TaxID=416872 RepID=A0ABU3NAE5_9GAMM|nr:ATP-dependent zinc protease [Halomonas saccharevitans]MDT8878181.1 ATP-dependent zinc protease [Halomonas saccharevitans]